MIDHPTPSGDEGRALDTGIRQRVSALDGGVRVPAGGNHAFLLDDPDAVWIVRAGAVDVFSVRIEAAAATGARRHLHRAVAGEALFGIDFAELGGRRGLIAVGGPDATIARLPRRQFAALVHEPGGSELLVRLVDNWVGGLLRATDERAAATASRVAGDEKRPFRHLLPWVRIATGGDGAHASTTFVPEAMRDGDLPAADADGAEPPTGNTADLLRRAVLWPSVAEFHRRLLARLEHKLARDDDRERRRLRRKAQSDRRALEEAVTRLGTMLEAPSESAGDGDGDGDGDALLAACQLVGLSLGVRIRAHPFAEPTADTDQALLRIARASGVRIRRVVLSERWWTSDCGPLLGFARSGDDASRPVALVKTATGYEAVDPASGERSAVDAGSAETLAPYAYSFYRPFPARALRLVDILRLGLSGCRRDLGVIVLMGMSAGLLSTVFPIATGILFDQVIPGAERGQLVQLTLALLTCITAMTIFQVIRGVAMIRLEAKMGAAMQAAVWDRLLGLPVPFFRRFEAGDLTLRGLGIDAIRAILSSTTIGSILSSLFSVFNLALLFYYDASLAPVAVLLVLVAVAASSAIGAVQVRQQRRLVAMEGKLAGLVLQLLSGIGKFRVAGAELRVFARWAREFGALRAVAFRVRNIRNGLAVFHALYPPLTSLVLFALVGGAAADATGLTTGRFLAFFAAFTLLLSATLDLAMTAVFSLEVVPLYERARPILESVPEVDEVKAIPGPLSGQLEVSRLTFRYGEDGPLVLRDVTFAVQPGEFLAVVGPSGCGKSTLLRLLLGFEQPLAGAIYYDGQDLATLDVGEVRRQIGTVPQNGQLLAADIFTNIVGSTGATLDEAMEAARLAGLKRDLEAMPMGVHTVVGEGGTGLSGGQRQRLMIARAVVTRPKVLFLDEATSALDNRSQALVSERLEALDSTRVVIAHRLSTIRNADRILVFDDGRIVEQGDYDELMAQDGPFRRLAERQMA